MPRKPTTEGAMEMVYELMAAASAKSTPLKATWNECVGAGRAHEGLRANWLEQLKLAVDTCGFRYIRFHGLLHDEMFVYKEVNGQPVYNWQYIDELFDRLLDAGIRPFVELGFMPNDLASAEGYQFWWKGNVTPPKSDEKWQGLIDAMIRHWISRYGVDEVLTWYFEVWNEPNLNGFWKGTRSEYFHLYKITVQAIKAIHPYLRVGGPSTSNFVPDDRFDSEREDRSRHTTFTSPNIDEADWRPVWMEAFLDFCKVEGLPVDFVCTHPYPTDWALDGTGTGRNYSRTVDATRRDLERLGDILRNSAYPDAEMHLTEWSSTPSPRDHGHDYLPAAAYIVKVNLDTADLTDSLSYWVFTDVFEESGAGDSIFHGGFGMINFQGIVKPVYHGYRFLNKLGREELARCDKGIVTRHPSSGKLSALLYHYDEQAVPTAVPNAVVREQAEATQAMGSKAILRLTLQDLAPGAAFTIETIDEDNGFAIPAWKAMGSPEPPTREQTQVLRGIASAGKKELIYANAEGILDLNLHLSPWSLVSVNEM